MHDKITPQHVLDLILAFKNSHESFGEVMEQQHVESLSSAVAEMTDAFGKFMTSLDLFEHFTRLGIYIRNFDDAKTVLIKLCALVNDRLEIEQPDETKVQMDRLFQICHDVGRISAAFSRRLRLYYPDDFIPGSHLFSEN